MSCCEVTLAQGLVSAFDTYTYVVLLAPRTTKLEYILCILLFTVDHHKTHVLLFLPTLNATANVGKDVLYIEYILRVSTWNGKTVSEWL